MKPINFSSQDKSSGGFGARASAPELFGNSEQLQPTVTTPKRQPHQGNIDLRLANVEEVYVALRPFLDQDWFKINEIVEESGLSNATVHRHLKTLEADGRAEHNGKANFERKWRRL